MHRYIENLIQTEPASEQPSGDPEISVTSESANRQPISEMNSEELKTFLCEELNAEDLPVVVLDDFVRESITGKIFLTLSEKDLKDEFPSATFGVRRQFKIIIGNYHMSLSKEAKNQVPFVECLRPFDKTVKHTDKYIKGRCVDITVNRRGLKLETLRNFHTLQDQSKDETLDIIGSEVVQFASACLNERRNGTIYFGISSADSYIYKGGEIIGIDVPHEEVKFSIQDCLHESFHISSKSIIINTVRDAKFVPVVSEGEQSTHRYVIEVDVVPTSDILGEERIYTKLKCLPNNIQKRHKGKDEVIFRFSDEGFPKIISSHVLHLNEIQDQKKISEQRKKEEEAKLQTEYPDLKMKLLNLLTGGSKIIEDDVSFFLVTSPTDDHMDIDFLSTNFGFIKDIGPDVVFDFDPKGSSEGVYANLNFDEGLLIRTLNTDHFNEDQSREDKKKLIDSWGNRGISWVFCNGYESTNWHQMNPREWNKERRSSFREALKCFIDNFGKERIIILFCLFSKSYEIMLEATDEALGMLPDQWIMMAESNEIAMAWQETVLSRNRVEKHDVKERCVVGMPWQQLNNTIHSVVKQPDVNTYYLPCSTGGVVEVHRKKLNDWRDLDIVSALTPDFTVQKRDEKQKKLEESFFKGEEVDWLNFHFEGQVLKRDHHNDFVKIVKDALTGRNKDEDDKVTHVTFYHQPGAGGTTSAKHVLWEFKKEYRCCTVKQISEHTCEQLVEFRGYGEPNPKPILILLDNEDEEKLIYSLESRGREIQKGSENPFDVFCTIILCKRRALLPRQLTMYQIGLRQSLTPDELAWFHKKKDSMTTKFEENNENANPKHLISFNIMRANFNPKYIKNVVTDFCDAITDEWEMNLLTIVSLLNAYDPDFRAVHVSCLDKLLKKPVNTHTGQGLLCRGKNWEAMLSQCLKLLLNLSSIRNSRNVKPRKTIRVFNKNIALETLKAMKSKTLKPESKTMDWLLKNCVFDTEFSEPKHIQSIITNVLKKRDFDKVGRRRKFSRFILYVQGQEGPEIAVELLEELFHRTRDAFTAQIISRFYIEMKNWTKAEEFAKTAIAKKPQIPMLWDTYGQVFKNQLGDALKDLIMNQLLLNMDAGHEDDFSTATLYQIIQVARKCVNIFKDEQSKETDSGQIVIAGYFGELKAILMLLHALRMCPAFGDSKELHIFLVFPDYNPPHLGFLGDEDRKFLKTLHQRAAAAMRYLDEIFLQLKGSTKLNKEWQMFEKHREQLFQIKVELDIYLGEYEDGIPQDLNFEEKCEYRWRRARQLGGTSLNVQLSTAGRSKEGKEKIRKIYELMVDNVQCQDKDIKADYLLTLLDSVTSLLVHNAMPQNLTYESILSWSQHLYNLDDRPNLEKFLYLALFHFPTKERQEYELYPVFDLTKALNDWQKVFKSRMPHDNTIHNLPMWKETTLFFLGNQSPPRDIVRQEDLRVLDGGTKTEKFNHPDLGKLLQNLDGVLKHGGDSIGYTVVTKGGNRYEIDIPTAYRVHKQELWSKRVYFYLGFSFKGPKAYAISINRLERVNIPILSEQDVIGSPPPQDKIHIETLAQRIDEWKKAKKTFRSTKVNKSAQRQELDLQKRQLKGFMSKLLDQEDE